jgi:small subunit ribosomal protein S21
MNLYGRKVIVKDGNVEKALRKLKKKVQESGLLLELKDRETYTKPSVKKKLARELAKRRWKKQIDQQNLPKSKF